MAQYNLGVANAEAIGVTRDDGEAVKWYRRAAEQGNADAQANLGFMYQKGLGVAQDYGEALKWFRRGVEQGHAIAQYLWVRSGRSITILVSRLFPKKPPFARGSRIVRFGP